MSDFDDAIAEIESGLTKLRAYGDARYRQGVADERKRAIEAIQGPTNNLVEAKPQPIAKTSQVRKMPVRTVLAPANRVRAPRGLAKAMIDRALKEAGGKGITSQGVADTAKNSLEKMVSVSAIRNEFRLMRSVRKVSFNEGKWYAVRNAAD